MHFIKIQYFMLYINSSNKHLMYYFLLQLLHILIFKISAAGTDLKHTSLLPATVRFAVKYEPGRWNTGHLATL